MIVHAMRGTNPRMKLFLKNNTGFYIRIPLTKILIIFWYE